MTPTTVPRRRVGVKALITRGEQVLLTRERRSDGTIYHSLPGGGVEPGETPYEALSRELREELDCTAAIGEQVGSCSYQHRSIDATTEYDLYAVSLDGEPTPDPGEGIVGVAFHDPAALPESMLEPLAEAVGRLERGTAVQRAVWTSVEPVLGD
ncbi:NUDIX domain-containing protein (plasmid) [Salinirubellus salinus]|uniref:NUDIX domain-containing protein n=1 Tax=Salinirubellus salinus TaxID=1364945 RepID=A0A9E7UAG9_9EURY|nr:NUDIX domain-containing protein [Salinirubellus salinus]UWM56956.1 NUDIX domain-containing protein [Salinirubellus salinus]